LPPTPTTVCVLKAIQAFQALSGDLIEFSEIMLTLRMGCCRSRLFNTAKDLTHGDFRFETEITKSLRGDRSGKKAAHGLFRAAIRVVNQVRKSVEHCGRHAWRHLDDNRSRVSSPFFRNVERNCHAITAHLPRTRDKLFNAMLIDVKSLFHCI